MFLETVPLHKINPAVLEIEVEREVFSTSAPLPWWRWSRPSCLQLDQTSDQYGWGCPEPEEVSRPASAKVGPSVLVTKKLPSHLPLSHHSLCFLYSPPCSVSPCRDTLWEKPCPHTLIFGTEVWGFWGWYANCCHVQHSTDFHTDPEQSLQAWPEAGMHLGLPFLSAKYIPFACHWLCRRGRAHPSPQTF